MASRLRGLLARRRRSVALIGVAVLALPALVFAGWSSTWAKQNGAPHRTATAVATPTVTIAPTPSASPSSDPSPTTTPTPSAAAVKAPPPPPRPPSAPAHPPAPPPPIVPPAPASVTLNVPWQHQTYNLSCEESSLSMVMAFFGRSVSDQDVLTYIGTDQLHYWAGPGGGDAYLDFVGDPNGSEVKNTGYGVYWPPLQSAAAHFGAPVTQAGQGIAAAAVYNAVGAGQPVIVWVTYDLAWHARTDYQAFDGRTIPYAGPEEHAMVVSGVSNSEVRLNDPDRGQYWISRGQFEIAYGVYGQMAVVFGSSGATRTPTPTPTLAPAPAPSPTQSQPSPSPTT